MVLVPVRQGNGTVGNVTEANKDAYVADLLRMFPIADHRVSVRAPYVTTTVLKGATAADDGGRSWETLLSEIESVRVGDGRTGQYYFGVGKIDYEAGIYGIAFRPGKSGLGNDYLDNRNLNASMTLAHETGHSMGRPHSQCGSVAGPDVSYPYPNGQIGSYGMDVATERLYGPDTKDLMGYCEDRWIGDYTYQKVLEHRLTVEDTLSRGSPPATVEPSLVVWGRMDDSGLTLEPAYEVETRPYLPAAPGPYTLEGLDASGARIFSISSPAARPMRRAAGGSSPTRSPRRWRSPAAWLRCGSRGPGARWCGAAAEPPAPPRSPRSIGPGCGPGGRKGGGCDSTGTPQRTRWWCSATPRRTRSSRSSAAERRPSASPPSRWRRSSPTGCTA
jgi:hypothetical protein